MVPRPGRVGRTGAVKDKGKPIKPVATLLRSRGWRIIRGGNRCSLNRSLGHKEQCQGFQVLRGSETPLNLNYRSLESEKPFSSNMGMTGCGNPAISEGRVMSSFDFYPRDLKTKMEEVEPSKLQPVVGSAGRQNAVVPPKEMGIGMSNPRLDRNRKVVRVLLPELETSDLVRGMLHWKIGDSSEGQGNEQDESHGELTNSLCGGDGDGDDMII